MWRYTADPSAWSEIRVHTKITVKLPICKHCTDRVIIFETGLLVLYFRSLRRSSMKRACTMFFYQQPFRVLRTFIQISYQMQLYKPQNGSTLSNSIGGDKNMHRSYNSNSNLYYGKISPPGHQKFTNAKIFVFCQNLAVPAELLWKWGSYRTILSCNKICICVEKRILQIKRSLNINRWWTKLLTWQWECNKEMCLLLNIKK